MFPEGEFDSPRRQPRESTLPKETLLNVNLHIMCSLFCHTESILFIPNKLNLKKKCDLNF